MTLATDLNRDTILSDFKIYLIVKANTANYSRQEKLNVPLQDTA